MTIRYEHEEIIHTTPELAFAAIDDLPRTAEWLPPCVSLAKEGAGPNTVGDKLRYVYKQGGREAEMDGAILRACPVNGFTANTSIRCSRYRSICAWLLGPTAH